MMILRAAAALAPGCAACCAAGVCAALGMGMGMESMEYFMGYALWLWVYWRGLVGFPLRGCLVFLFVCFVFLRLRLHVLRVHVLRSRGFTLCVLSSCIFYVFALFDVSRLGVLHPLRF